MHVLEERPRGLSPGFCVVSAGTSRVRLMPCTKGVRFQIPTQNSNQMEGLIPPSKGRGRDREVPKSARAVDPKMQLGEGHTGLKGVVSLLSVMLHCFGLLERSRSNNSLLLKLNNFLAKKSPHATETLLMKNETSTFEMEAFLHRVTIQPRSCTLISVSGNSHVRRTEHLFSNGIGFQIFMKSQHKTYRCH